MTDDEEKQLRRELLAADLELRRKQGFWETPRNIAILLGVVAAIAAAIGFWLGREAAPPPAPHASPVSHGNFGMTGDAFVEATQTASLVVITIMLIYVVIRLDRTLTAAAETVKKTLNESIKQQNQLQANVRRVWERIDALEERLNSPENKK